jgi:hypothetical protein
VRQQEQPSSRLPEAAPRAQRQQHQQHHPHRHHRLEDEEEAEAEDEVTVAKDADLQAEEEVTMHLQEAPDQHSKGTPMA